MTKKPKFTIITPCYSYNDWRYQMLLRAINSIENQTFKDYEHILVNDGSIHWPANPKAEKLKILNQDHQERIIAYNHAFEKAKGEWIALLDSDDESLPEKMLREVF